MRIILSIAVFILASCNSVKQKSSGELIEADKAFSSSAGKIGYGKAFIEYAHPDAVLLRKNNMPFVGKDAITALYQNVDTTGIKFSWDPLAGEIAQSGELGFTYGTYTFQKDTQLTRGTYVSVWKKDDTGKWKYILDTGNEGLGKIK